MRRVGLLVLGVVALFTLACATSGQPSEPTPPPPPEPLVSGVTLIYPPDPRTPLAQVPWCADHHGRSSVYPCRWDKRERPAPGWDPQLPPVAIWVLRSPTACVNVTRFIRISERFSCFYAPGS